MSDLATSNHKQELLSLFIWEEGLVPQAVVYCVIGVELVSVMHIGPNTLRSTTIT